MAVLSAAARRFLESYRKGFGGYQLAAKAAEEYCRSVLGNSTIPIHAISARAKGINSARSKLRKKSYRNPKRDLTDMIGLRVITYFGEDVDRVAERLSDWFEVSVRKSRDARNELQNDRFGYRSVHKIVRLRSGTARAERFRPLGRKWIEVQVRSILDHAWAEIEHETVYKTGIAYPKEVVRRFRAVAGALEVLEHAFSSLAQERNRLIDVYAARYKAGSDDKEKFDVARLVAFMESRFPESPGWRTEEMFPVDAGTAKLAVEILTFVGLQTARKLRVASSNQRFRTAISKFAGQRGLAPTEVSHLARVEIVAALTDPDRVKKQFPELLDDPLLAELMGG